MIRFLTLDETLAIHESQIALYGGTPGLRDLEILESALAMPQAGTVSGYVHGDLYEMAAAYLFHIAMNHPFLDGNKRVGLVAALVFLELNGITVDADENDLEALVFGVVGGLKSKSDVADFFRR